MNAGDDGKSWLIVSMLVIFFFLSFFLSPSNWTSC